MRWLLNCLLHQQGFEVGTADDGVQALSWVQKETPQAILQIGPHEIHTLTRQF